MCKGKQTAAEAGKAENDPSRYVIVPRLDDGVCVY